jgi:uncharacterized integral membrane protein
MSTKAIAVVVAVILFVILVVQNTEVVTLQLLFWKVTMSRIILLSLVGLIGFVAGYFARRVSRKSAGRQEM